MQRAYSSLKNEGTLDAAVFTWDQAALVPYGFWCIPALFVCICAGMWVPFVLLLVPVFFVATLLGTLGGIFMVQGVEVRMNLNGVKLSGYFGNFPWFRTLELPVLGTTLRWDSNIEVFGKKLHTLTWSSQGETYVQPACLLTLQEIQEMHQQLQDLRAPARERFGEGDSEVPEALRPAGQTTT